MEDEFYNSTKFWRKQVNRLQGLLVTSKEIRTLQTECYNLEECMKRFMTTHEQLEMATESSIKKIALFNRFEEMRKEDNQVLQNVYQAIRDLKFDMEDGQSVTSQKTYKSHTSHKSGRSIATVSSRASTSSSRQRRQELEAGAAALRAKMRVARAKKQANRANKEALQAIKHKLQAIEEEEKRVTNPI